MRYILILIIQLYWKYIPASKRKRCLFKKSCSQYVYTITKTEGLLAGIKALRFRYLHCRHGYAIVEVPSQIILVSANNSVFLQEEIHPRLLTNYELLHNESI